MQKGHYEPETNKKSAGRLHDMQERLHVRLRLTLVSTSQADVGPYEVSDGMQCGHSTDVHERRTLFIRQ